MVYREVFRQFVLMDRRIVNTLDQVIDSYGLGLPQWKVIDFIDRSGTCTLVKISRYLSIEKPSVTRTIHSLETRELVEQITGKDKREKRIRLTGLGKKIHTACRNALDKTELDLLKGISGREQKILLRLLSTIQENLK